MRAVSALLILVWAVFFTVLVQAEELVKGPGGWQDDRRDDVRTLSNGNATVTVLPWQSLDGVSVEQWLTSIEHSDPAGGRLLSSGGVKPESVPGAFAVLRKAQFRDGEGKSVLYGCPGEAGYARLITFDVINGGFVDMLKGGLFLEKVCKNEPPGTAKSDDPSVVSQAPAGNDDVRSLSAGQDGAAEVVDGSRALALSDIPDEAVAALNRQIPEGNRPSGAGTYLYSRFVGFPATLVYKVAMVIDFPGGEQLACVDWDPAGRFPSREMLAGKACQGAKKRSVSRLKGFKPGERVALAFGTIQAFGIEGLEGGASSISGGDLLMNRDGTIAIGGWSANHVSASAASARATASSHQGLTGRYYLDGHTISIVGTDGEHYQGFIGYSVGDDGKISAIYLNGKHYWDRVAAKNKE